MLRQLSLSLRYLDSLDTALWYRATTIITLSIPAIPPRGGYIPCIHAIAVIYCLRKAPIDSMPTYCRAETYKESYRINLPVANTEHLSSYPAIETPGYLVNPEPEEKVELGLMGDLEIGNTLRTPQVARAEESVNNESNLVLEPLVTRVPWGRPAKKRRRIGDCTSGTPTLGQEIAIRAPPQCSTCHKVGHYAWTCQQSHV